MKLAVVGSYGVGLTMRVPRFPEAGETLSGGLFDEGHGGKGSNQAVGAARLGAQVSLLAAVGDDEYGRAAARLWQAEGIDASATLVVRNAATMVGFILVDPVGENLITIAPGALDQLDADAVASFRPAIEEAELLVVSMEIPFGAILAALRVAREVGTRTLLNPAPAKPLPDEAWALIDVLTPNQTEARILMGLDVADELDDSTLVEMLKARTAASIVLTRGGEGALVATSEGLIAIKPIPVEQVVDTTGAGDAFTAALAVALADGRTLEAAAAFASRAGALAVTKAGVIPALPTTDQLMNQTGALR